MAFSQGASLAATLMIRTSQQGAEGRIHPPFKCAIFFSGGIPGDPVALGHDQIRALDYATDGELIHVPTAHIWGANDRQRPTFGPILSKLSNAALRTVYIHNGGHEVPGPRDQVALSSTVKAIQKTIDMVLCSQ
jgi:predicted esterase